MKGKEKKKLLKNKVPRWKQKNGAPSLTQGTVEEMENWDKGLTF